MQRQLSFSVDKPTLYLVPTPIGNLEDITLRALNVLKSVDIIFCEDTRVSQKLLQHYEIKKPLKSFHEHNKTVAINDVLSSLHAGSNIALISDAGMPIISDPGFELVSIVRDEGFLVVSLPGANAALTALITSGIDSKQFTFIGFLDAKNSKKTKMLEDLKYKPETLIFYEAPHRILDTIQTLYTVLGDRKVSLCRELTKTYEEIITGNLSELSTLEPLKGEFVIIVSGYQNTQGVDTSVSITKQIEGFMKEGLSKTEAMKKLSLLSGVPKNKIYQDYLAENDNK